MVAYSSEEYESSNGTRATDSGIGSIGRHESPRAFSSGLSSSAPPGTSVGDSEINTWERSGYQWTARQSTVGEE